MKVAIIAPINFLKKYCVTDFQFCYASILLDSEPYRQFYKEKLEQKQIVVVDHYPKLPRKPLDLSGYLVATSYLESKPLWKILPDVEFSWEKTVRLASLWYSYEEVKSSTCVGVIQGSNLEELDKCYRALRTFCPVLALASSAEKILARDLICEELGITEPYIFIETYRDPVEEIPSSESAVGVVTSFPIRQAHDNRRIDEVRPTPKPLDFYVKEDPSPKLTEQNLEDYLDLFE